jgi:hypothetical protein
MSLTEAQKRARDKYNSNNLTAITIRVPNAEAQALDEYINTNDVSKAGFIRRFVKEAIKAPISEWDKIDGYCLEHDTSMSDLLLAYINEHQ